MPVELTATIEGEQQVSRRLGIVADGVKNFREPLEKIGTEMLHSFDLNFAARGALFGGWVPRKKEYSWPLLERTGRLRSGFQKTVHNEYAVLFNNVDYFPYHQSSGPRSKLPRRVMMKIDAQRKQFIQKALQAYIVGLTRGVERGF